jgi:hypothetical protein
MRSFRICLGLIILLVATGRLFGQAGATGTILGTVTDSTGAIVPDTKVTVTNTATNVAFHTASNSAGDYYAPSLQPGTYSVSAEAKGFQKSVTTGFVLAVDQKIRVDLALKPGAITDTVEVTAQAVALDTDSAALSQLVSQQQVEELPLNGRNFMQLLLVGAGAVTVGGEQGTMRQGEGDAISVNGGRPEGNNYTLDGLVNTDPALVTPAVILSQDAIQEFKVESGTYPAEYGFSASQVNIVSKGGTNKLHGSFFEDDRNNAFDALPFPTAINFNSATATTNPTLRQNQFGFVLDGPVYIPKLYDGRNKTFWMANYEGWRINNGSIAEESVPNPAILTGDFSAETYPTGIKRADGTSLPGGVLPAYGTADCSTLITAGYNCMPVDPLTGQGFPQNKVPASRFTSRLGQVAVANHFWGNPTVASQPEGTTNFIASVPGLLKTNQQTYRGDQTLGKYGSVFFRYTHATYQNESLYNSGSIDYGLESYFENQDNYEFSHTVNIGQRNVNTFRFGRLRAQAPEGDENEPTAAAISALGMTGVFTTFQPLQDSWPNLSPTSFTTGGGSGNAYSGSDSPNWEYQDAFTSIHGKHTLGFGVDYRTYHLIRNLDDDWFGTYGFSSALIQTNNEDGSCPNAPVSVNGAKPVSLCGTGNAVADIMLGYYSGASNFVPGPLSPPGIAGNPQDHVFKYFAPYGEDDWKVTPKLSINFGLRWDFRAATSEASNHFFWLDTKNADGGLCYADPKLSTDGVAPGTGVYGSNPILRYCGSVPHPGSKTPFAPRFGVNYRINDKMVVRGGYGIFFDSYEGREIDDSADIYPYSIRNNLTPTTANSSDTLKTTNQLYPSFSKLAPFPESTLSFIAVIESENPLDPYVQSWTASVERELARNTTLEVNYIGTHAVHLLDRRDIAQPYNLPAADRGFCQMQDSSGNYINNTKFPCNPYAADPSTGQFTRLPLPDFNGLYIDSDFHGYSHYNAMNVKFEHRAGDMAITSIYTWANSKDDKSAAAGVGATGTGYQGFMDNHNPQLDYGPSDFDVDNRFVASYVYNLPIGRGKKIAGGINRAADLAIGGWELTGITTFQTGFPFGIGAGDIDGMQGLEAPRANITQGCDYHAGLTQKFQRLNLSCFTQPIAATTGDSKRNFLRQPGINNFDMGFAKNFHFTERLNFKLNVDTFNTFNHHQYAGDVGGLVVGGSGGNEVIDTGINDSDNIRGKITGASSPRIIQLAGKLTF